MKKLYIYILPLVLFNSCSKSIYGKYNTTYSKDKSAFFQITLNPDGTVEKTEIHTISISARGNFVVKDKQIICYLGTSLENFPPDTLTFNLKGNKLFFVNKNIYKTKNYLKKI